MVVFLKCPFNFFRGWCLVSPFYWNECSQVRRVPFFEVLSFVLRWAEKKGVARMESGMKGEVGEGEGMGEEEEEEKGREMEARKVILEIMGALGEVTVALEARLEGASLERVCLGLGCLGTEEGMRVEVAKRPLSKA